MTQALFTLDAAPQRWRGPLLSKHGAHLVMVVARRDARTPPLSEIRDQVATDARVAAIEARRRAASLAL